ncbi:hypothetical protein C8J57DRAFT_981168, partial [Mycena rebaudengoi]
MSAFNVLGFFQLKGGRRVPTQKANTAYTVWHIHYSTHIHCGDPDATAISAELRQYSSSTTETMPDRTVVFALCKAQALPNSTISLDAVTFIPIPGDPSLDAYDDHLPNEITSFVSAVGHVTGPVEILDDGHSSRAFPLAVSDYVGGTNKASTIQCIFDLSSARWVNTPTPAVNTCVHVYGSCRGVNSTGILHVKLESIALNIGSNANASAAASSSATSSSAPVTPQKRRKFSPPAVDSPSKSTP